MKISIKNVLLSVMIGVATLFATDIKAQGKKAGKESKTASTFKYNQYVMVTMKDGSEIPAIISSVKSKNKYYIRKWGGGRRGLVSSKFLRAMTKEEIAELKSKKEALSKADN